MQLLFLQLIENVLISEKNYKDFMIYFTRSSCTYQIEHIYTATR